MTLAAIGTGPRCLNRASRQSSKSYMFFARRSLRKDPPIDAFTFHLKRPPALDSWSLFCTNVIDLSQMTTVLIPQAQPVRRPTRRCMLSCHSLDCDLSCHSSSPPSHLALPLLLSAGQLVLRRVGLGREYLRGAIVIAVGCQCTDRTGWRGRNVGGSFRGGGGLVDGLTGCVSSRLWEQILMVLTSRRQPALFLLLPVFLQLRVRDSLCCNLSPVFAFDSLDFSSCSGF